MFLNKDKFTILTIIGIFLIIPLSAILNGFLLMSLWFWFITPLGVIPLTLPHAIGIGIIANLFKKNVTDKDLDKLVMENAVFLGVIYLFGYIVHLFM